MNDRVVETLAPPAPPAYALHSHENVFGAALLGGPLGGAFVFATNLRRLGRGRQAAGAVVLGALGTCAPLALASAAGSLASVGGGIGVLAAYVIYSASKSILGGELERHLSLGGRKASGVAALALGLLGAAPAVLLLLATGAIPLRVLADQSLELEGGDEVLYSREIRPDEARRLGEHLRSIGWFQGRRGRARLERAGGGWVVSFPLEEGAWNDPEVRGAYARVQSTLVEAFPGDAPRVHLCDASFETRVEALESTETALRLAGGDVLWYPADLAQDDARRLAAHLASIGCFQGRGDWIRLERVQGGLALWLFPREGHDSESWERVRSDLAEILPGVEIELHLADSTGCARRVLRGPVDRLFRLSDDTIQYSADIPEEEVARLADYLGTAGYFAGESTVRVASRNGGWIVDFYLREGAWDEPGIRSWVLDRRIELAEAFPGRSIVIRLCDSTFEPRRTLDGPIDRRLRFEGGDCVLHPEEVPEAVARAVGDYLLSIGLLSGSGIAVRLEPIEGGWAVSFRVESTSAEDAEVLAGFDSYRTGLAARLPGERIEIRLCDLDFRPRRTIP